MCKKLLSICNCIGIFCHFTQYHLLKINKEQLKSETIWGQCYCKYWLFSSRSFTSHCRFSWNVITSFIFRQRLAVPADFHSVFIMQRGAVWQSATWKQGYRETGGKKEMREGEPLCGAPRLCSGSWVWQAPFHCYPFVLRALQWSSGVSRPCGLDPLRSPLAPCCFCFCTRRRNSDERLEQTRSHATRALDRL